MQLHDLFGSLPVDAIYKGMWRVLSGAENEKKYNRFTLSDRKAIVEILAETVKDLPGPPRGSAPTKGRMLDHIGLEVTGLEAFCARLASMGVKV